MKIGIIGTGAVGESLGRYLLLKDQKVTGYYSKTPKHLDEVSKRTGISPLKSIEALIEKSDLIIIAVNDDAIESVSNQIAESFHKLFGKTFIHTSGVHSSDLLIEVKKRGGATLSLHPLQSFSDVENAIQMIPRTQFSIEGDTTPKLLDWLKDIEINVFIIPSAHKVSYHMAAVIVSNYLVSVLEFGTRQFEVLGYDQEFAMQALMPLIEGTFNNIKKHGTTEALSGPIARGDRSTVEKHLEILTGLDRKLYVALAENTLSMAIEKGLDEEKKRALMDLLKEANNG